MSVSDLSLHAAADAQAGVTTHLPAAKLLHWTIAVLFFLMFASGILMKQLSSGALSELLYATHKLAGVIVLLLMVLRLTYRVFARAKGIWAREAGAHPAHLALYAFGIIVPLLGWAGISDFGALTIAPWLTLPRIWPADAGYYAFFFLAHAWLAFATLALVVVHIGVAMRDHVMRGRSGVEAEQRPETNSGAKA